MNLFLQAFDEGWLTDGRGKKVYLSDAIVIMTSNLGSENFKKYEKPLGFGTKTLGDMKADQGRRDEGGRDAFLARVSQPHRRDRRLLAADDGRGARDRAALPRPSSSARWSGRARSLEVTEAARRPADREGLQPGLRRAFPEAPHRREGETADHGDVEDGPALRRRRARRRDHHRRGRGRSRRRLKTGQQSNPRRGVRTNAVALTPSSFVRTPLRLYTLRRASRLPSLSRIYKYHHDEKIALYPSRALVVALCLFTLAAAGVALSQTAQGAGSPSPAPAVKATPPRTSARRPSSSARSRRWAGGLPRRADGRLAAATSRRYKDGVATLPITLHRLPRLPRPRAHGVSAAAACAASRPTPATRGWLFDGMKRRPSTTSRPNRSATSASPMRTSLDNLLRGWWRAEGASLDLRRAARGGSRRAQRGRAPHLPGRLRGRVRVRRAATGCPPKVALQEEERGGRGGRGGRPLRAVPRPSARVLSPFVIDHYRAGMQSSRVNYEKVEFNKPVPDSLFERPADAKAIK